MNTYIPEAGYTKGIRCIKKTFAYAEYKWWYSLIQPVSYNVEKRFEISRTHFIRQAETQAG